MSTEQRPLGRTGADVSVVGLGTWQLGGDWGDVDDDTAADVLDAALDAGVTLLDTADVYGDGRCEVRIRRALVARSERPFVATKAGRRADPFEVAQYTPENLRAWIDRSRRNLGVDTLDLVQLHCPPSPVYSDRRVYDALDSFVEDGAIAAYGVSVETVTDGLPESLPALLWADKVLDRLAREGRPVEPGRSADLGDRLLALVAEAQAAGVDPEQALRDAVRKLL